MLDLLVEHGKDSGGRVACLKLDGEWVCKEIIFGALLVSFEGIVEYQLKVVGRNGSRGWVGHDPVAVMATQCVLITGKNSHGGSWIYDR